MTHGKKVIALKISPGNNEYSSQNDLDQSNFHVFFKLKNIAQKVICKSKSVSVLWRVAC